MRWWASPTDGVVCGNASSGCSTGSHGSSNDRRSELRRSPRMSEQHPDPETLVRYLRGDRPTEQTQEVETHLSGCVSCQRRVAELAGDGRESVVKWRGHLFGYEAAFDRAARQAS